MSLRLLLLLIGIGFILALLGWDYISRARRKKRPSEVLFDKDQRNSSAYAQLTEETAKSEHTVPLSERIKQQEEVELPLIPISAKKIRNEQADSEQIALRLNQGEQADSVATNGGSDFFGDIDIYEDHEAASEAVEDEILMLNILPQGNNNFAGLDILSATRHSGMKFGAMNIFHHYGVGDMALDKPLFSLANLFEPGEFDLEHMQDFHTRGLVMYMCLPTPFEGDLALEMMLNSAQRISEQIGGKLCSPDKTELVDADLQAMRNKLKKFQSVSANT